MLKTKSLRKLICLSGNKKSLIVPTNSLMVFLNLIWICLPMVDLNYLFQIMHAQKLPFLIKQNKLRLDLDKHVGHLELIIKTISQLFFTIRLIVFLNIIIISEKSNKSIIIISKFTFIHCDRIGIEITINKIINYHFFY
ncbi:Uncharacterised protein (plasmid) [Mesomycoplasma conjunctivae]|nr:Uncharacterised protein [Mesomycoplasma conjunctivae]